MNLIESSREKEDESPPTDKNERKSYYEEK